MDGGGEAGCQEKKKEEEASPIRLAVTRDPTAVQQMRMQGFASQKVQPWRLLLATECKFQLVHC